MSFALTAIKVNQDIVLAALLLCTVMVGGGFCFPLSYLQHSNVILGMLLFPVTLFITGKQRHNYLYLLCVVMFGCLSLMYSLRIAYFFTLAFFILWVVERLIGKCNPLILFLLAFMSPVFTQVSTILGFPLRLQLSQLSGAVLRAAGLDAHAEGNMIVLDGSVFSVDEACMGLNMLAMSMLMAVFMLGYRYRTTRQYAGFLKLSVFFLIVFLLNLLTNLFRILILVLFRIPPENWLHEIIGLLCFVLYVVVPVYLITARITKKQHDHTHQRPSVLSLNTFQKAWMFAFAMGVLFTGMAVGSQKADISVKHAELRFPVGRTERLNGGITKITTADLLIYVKPIPEFFTGEHTPLMCWEGSGYVFSGVKEVSVEGKTIYSGRLLKQQDELFTAWWYSNGEVETISQLDWRMRMFKREAKFCLVNITAKDERTLMKNVADVLRDRSLSLKYR